MGTVSTKSPIERELANTVSLPAPANAKLGAEIMDVDTGIIWRVAPAPGSTLAAPTHALVPTYDPGQALQSGSSQLALGTKTINTGITVSAASKIIASKSAPPGGGTPIGILHVMSRSVGGPGVGAFVVSALAEANQAVVAADVSFFDYAIVG